MGKPTGFLEYERKDGPVTAPKERIKNFKEFHGQLPEEEQRLQGARCMECGVPFCQAGTMIAGMASGCPLHNLVPEVNDLVWHGNWEQLMSACQRHTASRNLLPGSAPRCVRRLYLRAARKTGFHEGK